MSILIDTSFIIAFDNERDIHHKKAREIWQKIENKEFGQYFISDHVFDEIIGVSLRKKDKEKAEILGEKIIQSIPVININEHLFKETWRKFKELKQNFSFTDCSNIVVSKLTGSKIATFDKAFKEIKELEVLDS